MSTITTLPNSAPPLPPLIAPVDNPMDFFTILPPNSAPTLPPLIAPIDDTLNFSIPGQPNPFYIPNTQTPTCNCEQSSSSCNCPTPTPTPILSPTSTLTDNKKYMYIAGGLIIAFFIFRKK